MIDAGSSRSNVYLYEWPGAKENETGIVTETLNCKVDGESHITKRGGGGAGKLFLGFCKQKKKHKECVLNWRHSGY